MSLINFFFLFVYSFLFDKLDHSEQPTHHSSSSSTTTDSDSDEDRNGGDPSKPHRHNSRYGLDNLKRYRHAYSSSHHGGQSHPHHHHNNNNSHVPTNSASHHGRSKTPPSRGSSVAGSVSAQHSVSPSLGGSVSSNQMMMVEPTIIPQQGVPSLSPLGGGKRATKKRRKDPLAPKRPSNAFFIFSQQHRQQAREEKKEGNQSELTKFLGLRWKSMPTTEKKIYSELAIQDRQRYLDEMSQYEQEHGQEANDASKARKKTPGKVGRPSKHEKFAALDVQAKEDRNGNGNSNGNTNSPATTTTNGSGQSSLVKKKMEILSMINGDTEGEDMTSHDDEDDIRMEDITEDDHDHDNDHEEEEDEDDQDEDPEEEEEEEEEGDVTASEQDVSLSHAHPHEKATMNGGALRYSGHGGDDVDMVEAHRGQEPGSAHSLVASA
ncbi:hypothetical protein BGZ58_001331 [Dissophora ornata]|nr:hypothetical protein BGZ58_001331 [Dissophora ornata]